MFYFHLASIHRVKEFLLVLIFTLRQVYYLIQDRASS
jgi:hypothetical protein